MSDRNAEIIRRAVAGETYTGIAAAFGLSAGHVRLICEPVVGRRKDRVGEAARDLIRGMNASGINDREIARQIGSHHSTVRRLRIEMGVSPAYGIRDRFVDMPPAGDPVVDAFRAGETFSEIAARFGMTRNKVAGIIHRARIAAGIRERKSRKSGARQAGR